MKPILTAIALVLSASLGAQAKHYWISATTGADTNPGTKAQPFKTLQKGLLITNTDAVIHVMPGTYGPNSTGDFWDASTNTEKDIILTNYKNVKILGDNRDTCIIDFNGKGSLFWGFISVRGSATDNLEIANLTFQNIVATNWGSHWGCGPVIINGGAGKTDIHGCYFKDANAAYINWGAGTDNAFHHNVVERTVANTRAHAIRIRHGATSTTYVYNNTIINQNSGIGLAKQGKEYVCNNLILDSDTGMADDATASANGVCENNNCFNNTTNYTGTWSKSNISVDPQLVDKAKGNFRLKTTSPCIDAGYGQFLLYQLNDYYHGASCVDFDKDADAAPDIGAHELASVSLTIQTPWVQGGTPNVFFNSTDRNYALGFFALGLTPAGSPSVPFYKANPFGTIGMDTQTFLILLMSALPSAPNWNPVGTGIPTNPALDGLSLYAQGFAFTTTTSGDRFQPTGVLTITL